jgi:hypothetical protein
MRVDHFAGSALYEALGVHVSKSSSLATASPVPLFTVTGKVLINLLHGEVTVVVATTTTIKLQRKTGTVDMCSATTITSDAVGTMYWYGGDTGAVLNGADAPVVGFASQANVPVNPTIFGLAGVTNTEEIDLVTDQGGTGTIVWHMHYIPLEVGAKVVAA